MSDRTETTSPRLLSPAVACGLAGGMLVGLTSAVIAFTFIGPRRGYGFDFVDSLFVALIGGVFGVVAGASDTDEDEATAPAIKPSMTPAHRSA